MFGASRGPRPSADGPGHPRIIHPMQKSPAMHCKDRIRPGPVADPGHPRMARAIYGWLGVRDWPGNGGPFAESATGLATIQKSKNYVSN